MWKLSATSAKLPTTVPTPSSRKRNAVSTDEISKKAGVGLSQRLFTRVRLAGG